MKKLLSILSVLSLLTAIICVVMGVKVMFGGGSHLSFGLFGLVKSGTIFGFIGNLVSVVIMAGGFGMMGLQGLLCPTDSGARRKAFIWGGAMSVLSVISLVCVIAQGGAFTFGDLIFVGIPILYTAMVFKTA